MLRDSLFTKFMLAFVLVALTGSLLTALLANRIAASGLDLVTTRRAEAQALRLSDVVAGLYRHNIGWDGIAVVLEQFAPLQSPPASGPTARRRGPGGPVYDFWWLPDQRLILLNQSGAVVFDSENQVIGQRLSSESEASAAPVLVGSEKVGALIIGDSSASTLKQEFFDRVNRGLVLVAGVTSALAIFVAAIMSRQLITPIRQLMVAAQGIAGGKLDRRVSIRSGDEVGQMADAFNQMAENLQQSEQQRRQTLADIAHELRNPLAAVQATLEGMLDGVQPLTQEDVGNVYNQTVVLNRLVEDLQLLSLAQANQLHLNIAPTDLTGLVENVVESFGPLAEEQGTDLVATLPPSLPQVRIDGHRISQVLANLLSNALRYQKNGGKVEVSLKNIPGGVELSVSDDGPGISEADLPRIFERFYRVDQSRSRETGGSGLGLAITKELVEAHGGRIWVESQLGKGSRFLLQIPA